MVCETSLGASPLRRPASTSGWTCSRRATTETYCPYKGTATYWSARVGDEVVTDVAWSYQDPLPESAPLRGCLSFDESRVTLRHDMPIGD